MPKAHDMGGRLDPRRIDITSSNVKFNADWEREVFAITLALGFSGLWNLDRSRYCLLYTSPSPRDLSTSRMPSSA